MLVGISKLKRESLIQDIFSVIHQWPEIDRNVFCQAHYEGRSVDAISRSLQMNVEDVHRILEQCNRQLHASLRNLSEIAIEKSSLPAVDTTRSAA